MSTPWSFSPPAALDLELYKSNYEDLQGLSDADLEAHYISFGREEGREASAFAKREQFLGLFEGAQSVLEIGPGHKPSFRGPNVKYFDVLDADGLRQRAVEHTDESLDNCVEHVDYVSPTADMSIIDETFQVVYSSHNIEHQVDLIRHVEHVRGLLEPGGVFAGIMPDRRFCFDRNIPPASIGDVLEAYLEQRVRHKIADIVDQFAIPVHNNAADHWDDPATPPYYIDIGGLRRGVEEARKSDYVDVHAWRFSVMEFETIIRALIETGYIGFKNLTVYPTPYLRNEFCFILHD